MLFLVLSALVLAVPASPEALAAQAQAQAASAGTALGAQTLKPGDVVRLRIWREPDMSGEYVVDTDGTVVFPRVGEYQVLTDTPETLSLRLLQDFRQYLRNPSIEITVLRRVRVIGSVNNPGLFQLDPTMTIADALARAGGATPLGDPDKVQIIRNGEQVAVDVTGDTPIAESPIRSGDQLYVPERSWISRNTGVLTAAITGTVSLVIALFIR